MSYLKQKANIINLADISIKRLRGVNAPEKLSEQDILHVLKAYNLTDALKSIGEIYQHMFQVNESKDILRAFYYRYPDTGFILRADNLLKLAHLFIKSGANDHKRKYISDNLEPNIIFLNNIIGNHLEFDIKISQNTLINILLILNREQIELQKPSKYMIAKNFALFRKFDNEFKDVTGLTIQEYFWMGFILIMFLNRNKTYFKIKEVAEIMIEGKIPDFTIDKFKGFVEHLSIDCDSYKKEIKNMKNLIPLEIYPIICSKKYTYIVPSPAYLVTKIFDNIFFEIEKKYKKRNEFTEKFGLVFEEYIGDFLKCNYKEDCVIKEITYKKQGKLAQFTDWITIDNNIAQLIEVKSACIPLNAIYNNNIDDFIKIHILKALKQIITKLKDIDTNEKLKFLKDKTIVPIVVFRQAPFISLPFFQKKIKEYLEKNAETSKDIQEIQNYLINNNVYFFTSDDFETYIINKKLAPLEEIFNNIGAESIQSYLRKFPHYKNQNLFLDKIFNNIFPVLKKKS